MITLDIGCGKFKTPGSIGIDCHALPGVDIVHDANNPFTMFADNSIDKIIMSHCLEHLDDTVQVIIEMHRMLRTGGLLIIDVPHVSSLQAFADPTHKAFFTIQSMDFFTSRVATDYYSPARFDIIEQKILFMPGYKLLEPLFNTKPYYFEKWLRILPLFASIHWILRKV